MAHHVVATSNQSGNRAPSRRYAVPPSAPTPSSSQVRTADPFYGQEKVARTCHRFITHLFACPELPPNAQQTTTFPMHARLPYFIAYALHRTKLHQSVVTASLILLQRLKARFPTARGSSGHRLFISAFMISSKVICDDTYSNKSWTIVAQNMFNLREINQMEREMCNYLDWELTVDKAMLEHFTAYLDRNFAIDKDPIEIGKYDISLISKRMRIAPSSSSTPIPSSNDTSTSIPVGSRGSSPSRHSTSRSSSRSTSRDYASTPSPSFSASTSPASTAPPSTPPSSEDYSAAIASEDTSPPFQCIVAMHDLTEAERSMASHPLKNDMFAHAVAGNW